MKELVLGLLFAGVCFTTACKDADPCASLVDEICRGAEIPCDAARSWLDKEMVGPSQEKPTAEERVQACKLLLDDREALAGYREKAKSDLSPPR